jgi:hypothetical protein
MNNEANEMTGRTASLQDSIEAALRQAKAANAQAATVLDHVQAVEASRDSRRDRLWRVAA